MKPKILLLSVLALLNFTQCSNESGSPSTGGGISLPGIKLPAGFSIEVFADNVPGARSMTRGANGTLFVGTRGTGVVYAIVDSNKDYKADIVYKVAEGLDYPNGVAFRDGSLYVAEISRVIKFDNIEANLKNPPPYKIVNSSFPDDKTHGWKFIRFGPDGKLYVPVGAPCNACERSDNRYASIMRMNADGSGLEVYANGIRNTVGFDWNPATGELWFTDNGRDQLGDNIPPDELNRTETQGLHFGFPYFHGNGIKDPGFEGKDSINYRKPERELGPHVAALGMRFYNGQMFPPQYRGHVFIAEHGSWNRTDKIGYRVMLVKIENGKAATYEPFAEGWLKGDAVTGRPVDIEVLPDGSMLVSDDYAHVIYRITYK